MTKPCLDVQRDLDFFLDGELLSQERARVERHLAECASCRNRVDAHRALRLALRQQENIHLPDRVHRALTGRLDQEDKARSRPGTVVRFVHKPAVLLVAGALAGVLLLPLVQTSKSDGPQLVDAMISRHQLPLPMDVTGEPEKVGSWFAGKVPFLVPARRLEPVASLQGGRLADLGDREAVLLRYQRLGKPISVYIFDPRGLEISAPRTVIADREVFLPNARGYQVAVFRDRGLGYAITSELNQPEHLKLIHALVSEK